MYQPLCLSNLYLPLLHLFSIAPALLLIKFWYKLFMSLELASICGELYTLSWVIVTDYMLLSAENNKYLRFSLHYVTATLTILCTRHLQDTVPVGTMLHPYT
jgi:hypothetical protein